MDGSKNGRTLTILSKAVRVAIRLPTLLIKSALEIASAETASQDTRYGLFSRLTGWPSAPMDPSRETAWLDGLRGIAAFLVMAFHYNLMFFGYYTEAPYGSTLEPSKQATYAIWRLPLVRFFFASGHAQVGVFFVLSGFVLTWGPLARIRAGQSEKLLGSLSSAVLRRWFRLYLPCFVVGLLPMFAARMQWQVTLGVEVYPSIFTQLWDYLKACESFSRPLLRDRHHPNWLHKYDWVMWTIPLEFEGSMLVFVLLLSMARIKSFAKRRFIISTVAIYAAVLGYWTYWLFATGMLTADYVREAGGFASLVASTSGTSRSFWWAVFALGMWTAGVPSPNSQAYNRPGYEWLDGITPTVYKEQEGGARLWYSIAGISILSSGCHLRSIQKICESSIARYLGRISFMLYLTHSGVVTFPGVIFREWFLEAYGIKIHPDMKGIDAYELSFISYIVLYVLSWLVCGIPAVLLAHWCEVLVDRPSVRFAKWIEELLVDDGGSASMTTSGIQQERAISLPTHRAETND